MVSGIDGEAREAVARIARPIHGEPDLDRLLEPIAAARIVLIGEASHGTHELNDVRGTLTRKLIAEHGFAAESTASRQRVHGAQPGRQRLGAPCPGPQ